MGLSTHHAPTHHPLRAGSTAHHDAFQEPVDLEHARRTPMKLVATIETRAIAADLRRRSRRRRTLAPLLYRARPHVVIWFTACRARTDWRLGRRVKAEVPAPAVLVYSAYADAALAPAGSIAEADGIVR
jgi:hypothetical protein